MSRRVSHRLLRTTLAAVLTLGSVAFVAAPGAHGTGRRPDLPPSTFAALAKRFDPQLEKLGLRTTRGLLQNLDTYRPDPEGTHLAIYVEPIGEMTDAEFLDNVTKTSRIFLPKVFKQYADLESFDVCQEPVPGVDDREAPPPVTQLLVSREGYKRVRWRTATLDDLVEAALIEPGTPSASTRDFFLFINAQIAKQPEYQEALAAARAAATTTTSAAPAAG
jgi:hypothetical protein